MTASFESIENAASRLAGGDEPLHAKLVTPEPPESLAMVGDDRYLSVMSRRMFRAGLTHRQVDARWPAFETAFQGFELAFVSRLDDREIAELAKNESLIRHRGKLAAVRDNALAMQAVADEYGSFGVWLADWPEDDIVGLWHALRGRFRQLGGRSAPAFLRMAGKDTFMLTDWVVAALKHWSGWQGKTTSRQAHEKIQWQFNQWHHESGYPLCQMSQILAFSIAEK